MSLLSYPVKLLFKSHYRETQRSWAAALQARVQPLLPDGVTCRHAGWWPHCEPFFQVEELERVELRCKVGERVEISEQFTYPDEPTDGQIRTLAGGLLERAEKFRDYAATA